MSMNLLPLCMLGGFSPSRNSNHTISSLITFSTLFSFCL